MEFRLSDLSQAVEQLAIVHPGTWCVTTSDDCIMLVWSCDTSEVPDMTGDEPWSQWGGNSIISASGLGTPHGSGCDSYCDLYGDDVVTQWVLWEISA